MANDPFTALWVYLAASPLLWLSLTLVCYLIALRIYRLGGESPWLNPVAIAVALQGFPRGCYAAYARP